MKYLKYDTYVFNTAVPGLRLVFLNRVVQVFKETALSTICKKMGIRYSTTLTIDSGRQLLAASLAATINSYLVSSYIYIPGTYIL